MADTKAFAEAVKKSGTPAVNVATNDPDIGLPVVMSDGIAVGRMAAEHLGDDRLDVPDPRSGIENDRAVAPFDQVRLDVLRMERLLDDVHARFDLTDAAAAHAAIESRVNTGKVVLTP